MALKKTAAKKTETTNKRSTGYGRLSNGIGGRTVSDNSTKYAGRDRNSDSNQGGKFTRVTGLFETKTPGNLIGTTRQEIPLPNGGVIPEGTTFLVMESKPYEGKTPSYPYSLVIPPPRD